MSKIEHWVERLTPVKYIGTLDWFATIVFSIILAILSTVTYFIITMECN